MQCDRVEPICSQCKRAGKSCGGYRDLSALMFRSENERAAQLSVEAKAKSRARRRLEDGVALDSDISTPESRTESSPEELVRCTWDQASFSPNILAISTPLDDQGLGFFINRFVTPMPIRVGGYLRVNSVQESPFFREINSDSSLRDAVVSVGLAAMSNVKRDRPLRILSREKHARVIKTVREAVGNPAQANPDRIFPLIVMLSLYEVHYSSRSHSCPEELTLADGELCSQSIEFLDCTSRWCCCSTQTIGVSQVSHGFGPSGTIGILLCLDCQILLQGRWPTGYIKLVS